MSSMNGNNLYPNDSPHEKVPRTSHASSMEKQPEHSSRLDNDTPIVIVKKSRKNPIYASVDVDHRKKPFGSKKPPFPAPRKNNLTRPESANSDDFNPLDKQCILCVRYV